MAFSGAAGMPVLGGAGIAGTGGAGIAGQSGGGVQPRTGCGGLPARAARGLPAVGRRGAPADGVRGLPARGVRGESKAGANARSCPGTRPSFPWYRCCSSALLALSDLCEGDLPRRGHGRSESPLSVSGRRRAHKAHHAAAVVRPSPCRVPGACAAMDPTRTGPFGDPDHVCRLVPWKEPAQCAPPTPRVRPILLAPFQPPGNPTRSWPPGSGAGPWARSPSRSHC